MAFVEKDQRTAIHHHKKLIPVLELAKLREDLSLTRHLANHAGFSTILT
jgi:hypothetical protein